LPVPESAALPATSGCDPATPSLERSRLHARCRSDVSSRAHAPLTGQPYARVFHTDEKTGELHCHLAVDLIDRQTLTAKPLPFYKLRFKALARKLEEEFDLTRVNNYRENPIKYGATKAEEQQAQRLGFDKEAVRNTIRHCWDASDCGRSFDAAIAGVGLILAKGDRGHGNYLVIDPKGGLHVLSLNAPKRCVRILCLLFSHVLGFHLRV